MRMLSVLMIRMFPPKNTPLLTQIAAHPAPPRARHLHIHPTSGSDASGDGSALRPLQTLVAAVKTAGKGEIKCLAALPTTTIAEVSEQLGGMAGPLLAPSQQAASGVRRISMHDSD